MKTEQFASPETKQIKKEYKTNDGRVIKVPPKTIEHLRAHPNIANIIEEAIQKITLPEDNSFLQIEIDMERIIGKSGAIETLPIKLNEKTTFAKRINRDKPTRVIQNKEGHDTSVVSLLAFPSKNPYPKKTDGNYVLITAWIGNLAPREPWDTDIESDEERQKSLNFWNTHALIYDSKVMGPIIESTWEEILEK